MMVRPAALAALLAISGLAAGILEVVWSRQILVVLGAGGEPRAAALAVALAGVAIGALLGGRIAPRLARPLRGVALAHAVIAGSALVMPTVLGAAGGAGLALASIATIALGATVPLLARAAAPPVLAIAVSAGVAGAVLGIAATVPWLLEAIGVAGSSRLAGVIALVATAIAAALGRCPGAPAAPPPGSSTGALAIAALAGAGLAAAHLLYTRALALTLHGGAHAAAAVDAAMLIAIAAGVAVAARLAGRPPRLVIAATCAAAAILVPLSIASLWGLTRLGYVAIGGGLPGYVAGALGLALAVLGPPVIAIAVVLPSTWRWRDAVGGPLAAAALAAAGTTVVVTWLILPRLGPWGGLALVSALFALAALGLAGGGGPRVRLVAAVAGAVALGGALLARPTAPTRPREQVLARWHTADGLVEVVDGPGRRRLRVDLHEGRGASDQQVRLRRLGHLPMLLHAAPRRVLHLGLGTGIAAGTALGHAGVAEVDVVEASGAIVEAARWFASWNGRVLDDPRVRVHLADPRIWLREVGDRWDVIVTEPRSPWAPGVGIRHGVEHQRAIAAHLAPGGVHVQWLALWQIGEPELARIADAAAAAFPHVALWRGDASRRWGMIAVIGSDRPLALDGAALRARLAAITPEVGLDAGWAEPSALIALYVGDWPRRAGARLQGDDWPWLELAAPTPRRPGHALIAARLVRFYREVVALLPRAAVSYQPAPGEPAWDPDAGIALQMGGAGADGEPGD